MKLFGRNKGLIAGACALMLTPVVGAATVYTDVDNHWARDSIVRWVDAGVVQGNGTLFSPNEDITRGEFASILNAVMDYQFVSNETFYDLNGHKYGEDVRKLNAAGMMEGADGYARPDDTITRQEAAVVLAKALYMDYDTVSSTTFADDGSIATWAKSAVSAMAKIGMISGRDGNLFDPTAEITRGEVTAILSKGITQFVDTQGEYTLGTVGTTLVNSNSITLQNTRVEGDLLLTEGIAGGEIYLKNVVVTGNLVLNTSGESKVYLADVTVLGEVKTQTDLASSTLRLNLSGSTKIPLLTLTRGKLVVNSVSSTLLSRIDVAGGLACTVNGNIDSITVEESSATLNLNGAVNVVSLKVASYLNGQLYLAGTVLIGDEIVGGNTSGSDSSYGNYYPIGTGALLNGSVSVSTSMAQAGDLVGVGVVPDPGYMLHSLSMNGVALKVDSSHTAAFAMPSQAVVLIAVFIEIPIV